MVWIAQLSFDIFIKPIETVERIKKPNAKQNSTKSSKTRAEMLTRIEVNTPILPNWTIRF